VDGREPDVVLTGRLFDGLGRNGCMRYRQFNACGRWHQPAQAQLNHQYQHKGLASIRRQLGARRLVFRIGVSWVSA
jgi:hypothetical protein